MSLSELATDVSTEDAKKYLREKLYRTIEAMEEADEMYKALLDAPRSNHIVWDVEFDRVETKEILDKIHLMLWKLPSMKESLKLLKKMFPLGSLKISFHQDKLNMREHLCLDQLFAKHDYLTKEKEDETITFELTDKGREALFKFHCA